MNLWHARSFSTRGRAREEKKESRPPCRQSAASTGGKVTPGMIAGRLASALLGLQSESGRRYQSLIRICLKTRTVVLLCFAHSAVARRFSRQLSRRCHATHLQRMWKSARHSLICPLYVSSDSKMQCKPDEAVPFATTPATNHSDDDDGGDNTKDLIHPKKKTCALSV